VDQTANCSTKQEQNEKRSVFNFKVRRETREEDQVARYEGNERREWR